MIRLLVEEDEEMAVAEEAVEATEDRAGADSQLTWLTDSSSAQRP